MSRVIGHGVPDHLKTEGSRWIIICPSLGREGSTEATTAAACVGPWETSAEVRAAPSCRHATLQLPFNSRHVQVDMQRRDEVLTSRRTVVEGAGIGLASIR
jgi:hypothetical protein